MSAFGAFTFGVGSPYGVRDDVKELHQRGGIPVECLSVVDIANIWRPFELTTLYRKIIFAMMLQILGKPWWAWV